MRKSLAGREVQRTVRRRGRPEEEFDAFVRAHADRLLRIGYLLTGDLAETEDVVQEALARVARRWPRVASMASPAGYARRVLVNLVIDGAPRRARRGDELGQAYSSLVEYQIDPRSDRDFGAVDGQLSVLHALRRLPARQRAVLVLRYWEDLSEADTAQLLGCSTGSVKSMASRGLVRLRAVLAASPSSKEVI